MKAKYHLNGLTEWIEPKPIVIPTKYHESIVGYPTDIIPTSLEVYRLKVEVYELLKDLKLTVEIDTFSHYIVIEGNAEELMLVALSWKSEWGDRIYDDSKPST